jgi:hypothetical protein
LVGVWANSTLLAAAQSPTRVSLVVVMCGEKLSSTIAIRILGGYRLRR